MPKERESDSTISISNMPTHKQYSMLWPVLALTLEKLRELDELREILESIVQGREPAETHKVPLTIKQVAGILAVQPRTIRQHCVRLGLDPGKSLDPQEVKLVRQAIREARRRKHLAERNRSLRLAKKS
jgi:hypothetical protein